MLRFRFCIGLCLTLRSLAESKKSFLQLQRGRRAAGDWDDTELKLCTFDAKAGSENRVKVFADEQDNTRYVSFAREGYATDDGFIESMLKCKGPLPDICKHPNMSSIPPGCADCPCELDSKQSPCGNYQKRMLDILVPRCHATSGEQGTHPFNVLVVGLGGGAIVQHILAHCPGGTRLEAVEYDPRMIEIATRFFGLHASPSVFTAEQGDGGAIVASRVKQGETYSAVLVDAFAGGPHVPESCRDAAFIGNLQRILRKGGVVVHNMGGADPKVPLALYEKNFGSKFTELETLKGNNELPSSLIVARGS